MLLSSKFTFCSHLNFYNRVGFFNRIAVAQKDTPPLNRNNHSPPGHLHFFHVVLAICFATAKLVKLGLR